ncbi:MAG: putative transcriptional regulator YheO [Arenicella sp.]|jgi:predicted transcriptional regulator YheO
MCNNQETQSLIESEANSTEAIYVQTIAEKFTFEKRQIVQELKKYGIFSILTAPQDLTVNTINKYLELKARGLL